jgi:hypothetical protein
MPSSELTQNFSLAYRLKLRWRGPDLGVSFLSSSFIPPPHPLSLARDFRISSLNTPSQSNHGEDSSPSEQILTRARNRRAKAERALRRSSGSGRRSRLNSIVELMGEVYMNEFCVDFFWYVMRFVSIYSYGQVRYGAASD